MTESVTEILKDSVSKKKRYIKYILPIILIGGGVAGYFFYQDKEPVAEEYVPEIYEAVKGTISSTVSSDGNIINPDIVNLSFLTNGTLKNVSVKEGDKVEAGQLLAELDKRDLQFDLESAENDVNISWQNIKAKEADITDIEIINAESDFEIIQNQIEVNKQNALQDFNIARERAESDEKTAKQDLEQIVTDAKLNLNNAFLEFKKALQEVNYVFGIEEHYNGITVSAAFNNSVGESRIENYFYDISRLQTDLRSQYENAEQSLTNEQLIDYIENAQDIAKQLDSMFDEVTEIFATATEQTVVSQSTILSSLTSVQDYQSQIQSMDSILSRAVQDIEKASLNLENTLVAISNDLENVQQTYAKTLSDSENSIKDAELKIENSEKLVNQYNISKQTSLNIQYAQLAQSKLRVEKAQYNLDLADLKAPKAGTIIQVNGSAGESVKADVIDAENAFIRILSDANFTTEVSVEEIDIAKVKIGQETKITLDALPDAEIKGTVSYISSTAEIDNNGIVTYLVRIDIDDSQDAPIREGMTTYVDFILGQAVDVVIIPNSALIRERFVSLENGERREVKIGFTDGEFTEVTSGLDVGEKIVSNPETGERARGTGGQGGEGRRAGNGGGRELTPERIEQMKAAGFTDDEIAKLQAGEITDEMREKLQKMRESFQGGNALGGGGRGAGGRGGRPQ